MRQMALPARAFEATQIGLDPRRWPIMIFVNERIGARFGERR
jgi:hypothetical protein